MIERWQQNGLYFAATYRKLGRDSESSYWLVWCSFQPVTGENPIQEPPDQDVWFEVAPEKDEAIGRLIATMG